jgi:hypothetical protein
VSGWLDTANTCTSGQSVWWSQAFTLPPPVRLDGYVPSIEGWVAWFNRLSRDQGYHLSHVEIAPLVAHSRGVNSLLQANTNLVQRAALAFYTQITPQEYEYVAHDASEWLARMDVVVNGEICGRIQTQAGLYVLRRRLADANAPRSVWTLPAWTGCDGGYGRDARSCSPPPILLDNVDATPAAWCDWFNRLSEEGSHASVVSIEPPGGGMLFTSDVDRRLRIRRPAFLAFFFDESRRYEYTPIDTTPTNICAVACEDAWACARLEVAAGAFVGRIYRGGPWGGQCHAISRLLR